MMKERLQGVIVGLLIGTKTEDDIKTCLKQNN